MTGSRIVRWRDLRRWLPGSEGLPESPFAPVRLEDVLTRREEAVSAEAFGDAFSPITIRFGGKIERRDRSEPFAGRMWAVRPGDLVFSKIDVRNGAIGILPEAIGPAVVTGEYPVYVPDEEAVWGGFLSRLLRSAPFRDLLMSATSGTSGRKRVSWQDFEALEVPLPSLEEQRRIAAAHRTAHEEAGLLDAEADAAEAAAVTAFEAALGLTPPPDLPRQRSRIARFAEMERWSHEGAMHTAMSDGHAFDNAYPLVSLDDVAEVSYGISKSPKNRPGTHARPYLRVANVQANTLDLSVIKMIDVPDEDMERYRLNAGDILMCEGNSIDLVGRGAMWRGEIEDCVHQNHVLKVRVNDPKEVLPAYLLACINSSFGRAYFRSQAKQTTNLATINSTEVRGFDFPLPDSVEEQMELARALRAGLASADALRQSAAAARTAADAAFVAAVFGAGAEADPMKDSDLEA